MLLIPCILVFLCVKLYRNWNAPYQAIALLPLMPLPVWFAKFLFDIKRDPTSHNLFPFEVFFVIIAGFVILLIVSVLRTLWLNRNSKKLGG